jgi:hypothetical protein
MSIIYLLYIPIIKDFFLMEINNTVLALPTMNSFIKLLLNVIPCGLLIVYLDYLKDFDYLEQLII